MSPVSVRERLEFLLIWLKFEEEEEGDQHGDEE